MPFEKYYFCNECHADCGMKIVCPNCGNDRFVDFDEVIASRERNGWKLRGGKVVAQLKDVFV